MVKKDEQDKKEKALLRQLGFMSDDVKKEEENLCPRCIEDHDDEHGERVSGSKVVSSCDDCGVCENCEHLMECKGVKMEESDDDSDVPRTMIMTEELIRIEIAKDLEEIQKFNEEEKKKKIEKKEENRLQTEKNQLLMEQIRLLKEEEKKKVAMNKKFNEKHEQFIEDHEQFIEAMEENQKEIEAMGENPLLGEYQLKMLAAKKKFDENYEQIIEHHQKTTKAIDEWMAERSKREIKYAKEKKVGPDMRNCVYIKLVGKSMWRTEIEVGQYDYNELFNIYELVVPRKTKEFPYEVTFGALKSVGMHAVWGDRYNDVASAIYGGHLCDDVIVLDGDDEADDCGSVAKMEVTAQGLRDFIDADNKEHA